MGYFNSHSRLSEMGMYYFCVCKNIFKQSEKDLMRDGYYFCCYLQVSILQSGRWGFCKGQKSPFLSTHTIHPYLSQILQTALCPGGSAGSMVSFAPFHLSSQEDNPMDDPSSTVSLARTFLSCLYGASIPNLHLCPVTETCLSLKQGFPSHFSYEQNLLFCELIS